MSWKTKNFTLLKVALIFLCCLGLLVYITGMIDYIPQLRVSAQSPDGELIVSVYQQRLFPRPFFPRMGAFARITDRNGNLLYEEVIYHDDDWDDSVGSAFNKIAFEVNKIHISPGVYDPNKIFVIDRSDLALKK